MEEAHFLWLVRPRILIGISYTDSKRNYGEKPHKHNNSVKDTTSYKIDKHKRLSLHASKRPGYILGIPSCN